MTIRISVMRERGILEVTYVAATVTQEDLADQRSRVIDALSRNDMTKVLLDASSLASFPDPFVTLAHNEAVAENAVLREAKFAVVCSSLGQNERDLENTGVNRGVNMKCFTSREDALSWLG